MSYEKEGEHVVIKLQNPITHGTKTITELRFRELSSGDLRRLKTGADRPMAMQLELAGLLSGEVQQVIDKVRGKDIGDVLRIMQDFIVDSLGTGLEDSES